MFDKDNWANIDSGFSAARSGGGGMGGKQDPTEVGFA